MQSDRKIQKLLMIRRKRRKVQGAVEAVDDKKIESLTQPGSCRSC